MKRGEQGFTLIELMIVIAIIGILAAVAIPNFLNARGKAQDAAAKSTLEAVKTALEMYMADVGNYPSASTAAALVTALNTTGDLPSNVTTTGTDPGALIDYDDGSSLSTYMIVAIGRDATHYFQLTNAGVLTGPNSTAAATGP